MAGGKDRRVLLHFICARQSKSTEFLPFSKRQGTLPPGFPTLCVWQSRACQCTWSALVHSSQSRASHSLDCHRSLPQAWVCRQLGRSQPSVTSSAVTSKVVHTPVHMYMPVSVEKESLGHVKRVIVLVTAEFPLAWHKAWIFARVLC